ncbi:MAG TPA: glycosyltransferase family 39 protein [Gaiellaceae bacterium]|nr:glycosyltransferase family 39 protein [Gaiellaceae bacterium]
MRIFATRRAAVLVAVAAALPRLVVLLAERGNILSAYTEKSDTFAQTFVKTGTFGFIPGVPSASTQPLYGYFLIPLYWVFGRHWLVVGLAQIAVATTTALLVYAIGKRVAPRFAALAAIVATLNPYLIWHDVHVNREILDQLVLVALVLTVIVAVARRSLALVTLAGALCGVAILGNSRLSAVPVLVAIYVASRLPAQRVLAVVAILAAAALVVSPWVIRNKVSIGCFAVTTDGRALWKANNANTYSVLAHGGWIDDVPQDGLPPTAQAAYDHWLQTGQIEPVNECRQMTEFEHKTFVFWRHHPGEKAKLMAQATWLLWDPRSHETQGRSGKGTWRDTARRVVEPVYMIPLYALAIVGLFVAARWFAVLAGLLLAYNTATAMAFAGTTRYRVPFDFLLVLLAACAVSRYTRSTPSTAASGEN